MPIVRFTVATSATGTATEAGSSQQVHLSSMNWQKAVVSPEHLPLCHGGCDKISWLPDGKVFSNVQREKIISKFLKESVLKRVFRAKQAPSYQKEESSHSFPGTRKILREHRTSYSKMGRRNGETGGTNLRASDISHENLPHWSVDSEGPVSENKNHLPGRESAAGGKINKNHLEIPIEQMMLDLNLSEPAHKITQNSKQGSFQLWGYPLNEGSATENRDFKKSSMETGFNVTNNSRRLFTMNDPLSASVDKQIGSYPSLQMPLGLCWPYADGDFFKDRMEPRLTLYSTEDINSDIFSPLNWNLKYGNSSVEENLTDESDLSENEKANDTLLSYFKKMDLNLKPETIDTVEEPFTEESSEVFPYPDFLPPPFNTLDLHKLALSKSESWKGTMEPAESSVDRLITRLLEMERVQHLTVQKERPRLPSTFCTLAVNERPSSSKALSKGRQPKLSDSLSLQTMGIDKNREKRKSSSGPFSLEQNAAKWNWSNAGKYKWSSRPSLKSSTSAKQLIATYKDFKSPKSSILIPCQELSAKQVTAQTTPSLVKMVSARCLPPRSPVHVSPLPLSFPENQREEIKASRTKKKLYRKNIALDRPFYIQKLNCLSPSFIVKDKCSPINQK
ncbi:protein FAM217A-like isoform X3 [Talpa occidentalis]|uniref:protein FAM217A-like isoform X3 n=1 Tax=Talpa occidentalis TaxID=50954 RepID=UPI0023F7E7CF|nr:protein FAM217A-like isoform X3 [Talpa occidentalis]